MSKATKIWLIIAASLVLLGIIIFTVVMTVLKWDFRKLSTVKYETNTYTVTEDFNDISINTNTADIVFLPSDDGTFKIVAHEDSKEKHSVSVNNGTLTVEPVSTKKWYDYISIGIGAPKLTVYLPENEYGALKIKLSTGNLEIAKNYKFESIDITVTTGDINLKNVSAGSIEIKVSTGDTALTDVTAGSFKSTGGTGDINLSGVTVSGKLSIERSTGDVEFNKCDAAEILVVTDTGDVEGSLLSEKIFFTKTDTGKISVPKTTSGGKCDITTDTGNIKITID